MVGWAQADVVFHLAGLNGMAAPADVEHLCRALRNGSGARSIRMIAVGSAAELGLAASKTLPISEWSPCRPETAYGRSKLEVTRRALAEPHNSPLEIIVARTFNLVGAGLDARLALGSFSRQLAALANSGSNTGAIRCGPLAARRDYLDVRDAVEAYIALARRGVPGELYNVCAGRSHQIGELLNGLIRLAGVDASIDESQPAHAADVTAIHGDYRKLSRTTGWRPKTPLDSSLSALLASAGSRGARAAAMSRDAPSSCRGH